jgi:Ran GTPase-activating protein (RanGAP) involved in mRNA processing and transport
MTHSKHLREVIWNGNFVGIKGINFIVDALKEGSKIKSLSLRNASIGKVGLQTLSAGLYGNEYLKILDLGSNSITFESFKDLCDSLNNNKVRTLRLRNNAYRELANI